MLQSHRKTILEALGRGPIHPFPARMAPGIALEALGDGATAIKVLDPMAGSGTALAVARANGHHALGFDLDPLAVLLAGVWTRTIDPDHVTCKAEDVLDRAKFAFKTMRLSRAYPTRADDETRSFIRYWFDEYARRQLASLSLAIDRIEDSTARDALWVAFSRLIITKTAGSSLAMDLSHSRPHKKFTRAPVKPFKRFLSAVDLVISNCPHRGVPALGPVATVRRGDARAMNVGDRSIDLVLTSPPYLNAIDYMRCSKFSLVWMGYTVGELRKIRSDSIGSNSASEDPLNASWARTLIAQLGLHRRLSNRDLNHLSRYVSEMGGAISEVSRVLRTGGRAVYVIGDSTIHGTFVRNSSIITAIAEEKGLTVICRQSRKLPADRRYLPPPQTGNAAPMDSRLRREVVLAFAKQ